MAAKAKFKLSYMTWVAPEWDLQGLIDGANRFGYEGIELRVESGHKHGLELATPQADLEAARARLTEESLVFSAVATGLRFSAVEPAERAKVVESCKQYIEFARHLGAPYLRVFGGVLPKGIEVAAVVDYVAESLDECLEASDGSGVSILLETHDDFSNTRYVRELCKQLYSDHFGVVWDIAHPLRLLETLAEAYDNISGYVHHVHVHDMQYSDDRTQAETGALGEGFVRYDRAIEFLTQSGFDGHLSVELMKVDPLEVLPQYADKLRGYIALASGETVPIEETDTDQAKQKGAQPAAAKSGA